MPRNRIFSIDGTLQTHYYYCIIIIILRLCPLTLTQGIAARRYGQAKSSQKPEFGYKAWMF